MYYSDANMSFDPRQVKSYVDLDAPAEGDIEIKYWHQVDSIHNIALHQQIFQNTSLSSIDRFPSFQLTRTFSSTMYAIFWYFLTI